MELKLAADYTAEADLLASVMELARACGWTVWHFHDSRRQVGEVTYIGDADAKGFPDLVMVRKGDLIFAELKAEKEYPSPAQKDAHKKLSRAAAAYIWRPHDLPEIERRLA